MKKEEIKKYLFSALLTFCAAFLGQILVAINEEGVQILSDVDWPFVLSSGAVVAMRAALAGIVAAVLLLKKKGGDDARS